jgi:hypothetical protein
MAEPVLTGACLCGGVRFEIDEPFVTASWCHCTRCQRRSGVHASAQGRVAAGSVRVVSGAELIEEFRPPGGSAKAFCRVCGGQLWSADPESGEVRAVRLGAVDGDPGIRPSYHQYVAYAAPWQPLPDDGLPRYPERAG